MRFITNQSCTLDEAIAIIKQPRDKVSVDIETVDLINTLPLGIGIAISPSVAFYFFDMVDELAKSMTNSAKVVVFQNAKFDLQLLQKLGYGINDFEDTLQIAHASGIMEANLVTLSQEILLKQCPKVTDLWTRKGQKSNIGVDHVELGKICMVHAMRTYELEEKLIKTQLYATIDKPCVALLMEMEENGVLIDQYALTRVEHATMVRANALEARLKQQLGVDNLASNPKVAAALKKLGIIGTRKTKSAKESVGEESLKPLNLPITNDLLKWRSLMKTISTYVPALRNVDPDGRVRTVFGDTNTGRWRSGDKAMGRPNLQNLTRDSKFDGLELD